MASDTVILTVPARDEFARTVRMTAVTLAGRSGASVDVVDDVRIAVEEAYIYACELGGRDDRITFEFTLDASRFGLRVGPLCAPKECGEQAEGPQDRYARFILESVCDEFATYDEDGAVFVRITKRLGDEG
jgi:serine/threonine-protein kinase RsbW